MTEDKDLEKLAIEIDTQMTDWMMQYDIHPLNLCAIILARMVWLSRLGDFKEDFTQLLDEVKGNKKIDEELKGVVH